MLSLDEQTNGMTFILKLWDANGDPSQWVETLRGAVALRWYDIYRDSDWDALRAEALGVFHNSVTEEHAERVRSARHRCIYIHTESVRTNELEQRGMVLAM
jgi:hypothetical protein